MIKHVVLYKFKDTISQDTINDIIEKFNNCKSLEGIIDIQFGDNCSLKKHLNFLYKKLLARSCKVQCHIDIV